MVTACATLHCSPQAYQVSCSLSAIFTSGVQSAPSSSFFINELLPIPLSTSVFVQNPRWPRQIKRFDSGKTDCNEVAKSESTQTGFYPRRKLWWVATREGVRMVLLTAAVGIRTNTGMQGAGLWCSLNLGCSGTTRAAFLLFPVFQKCFREIGAA